MEEGIYKWQILSEIVPLVYLVGEIGLVDIIVPENRSCYGEPDQCAIETIFGFLLIVNDTNLKILAPALLRRSAQRAREFGGFNLKYEEFCLCFKKHSIANTLRSPYKSLIILKF